ncbi:MAG: InlB B-repeat-containing protein [Candidatus Coproplasma sp.]
MKRASKKLINAIIALVVSVILCIGVCLAWFSMNSDVSGNGLQTQVKSGDIVDFKVTAYYLDYDTNAYSVAKGNFTLNGTTITVDYNDDKIINTLSSESDGTKKDVMRPYSVSGGYTTAVLFKIDYEIVDGSTKKFRIFAECDKDSRLKVTDEDKDDNFISYLSNTVTFISATQSATASGTSTFAEGTDTTPDYTYTYTENADATAFVGGVGLREKDFNIGLKEGIEDTDKTDGTNFSGTEYFIMDYEKERFTYISSLLLESGGGLNSGLTLTGDISIGIEEYTDDETATPTSIVVDKLAYNYGTAYKQSMGAANVMKPNWQFVVTYSDGTQKVIVGTNSNLEITGVTTTTVGTGSATATYTETYNETDYSVSCSVPYTIGLAITGGSGVAIEGELQLSATGLGDGVTVTWSSFDESIATVDETTGLVKGVATGTTTITAKASTYVDDASTPHLIAKYTIVVTESNIPVTGVTLNTTTLTLGVGDVYNLLATVAPTNATNKAVTWTSSDSTVATVVDGVVTALKASESAITITVTTQGKDKDGNTCSATCSVTVSENIPVTSVTVTSSSSVTEMAKGDTTTLTATVKPDNATNKTVSWWSSDQNIATVNSKTGQVTAVSAGIVTIYAEAGDKTGSYTLMVKGVKISSTSETLTYGVDESVALTATVYPTTVDQTITWTTSDDTVATVSGGVVTVVGKGTATITATATDGSTATCTITVEAQTFTVTFNMNGHGTNTQAYVKDGDKVTKPSDPTISGYTFVGWYTDEACSDGNAFDFDTAITSDKTLYAKWKEKTKYTVTFNINGNGSSVIDSQQVYDGEYASEPDEPTATGYTFGGWYKEAGCTNKFDFASMTITGDITLYAKWTAESGTISEAVTFIPKSDTDSRFTVAGSAKSHDPITVGGISIPSNGALKLDSNGSVTFTTAVEMTMTLYLYNSNTIKVNNKPQSVTQVGTYYVYTATIEAGTYTISRDSSENSLYAIVLTPTSGETTSYTVTFKNGDETLQTGSVAEGNKPTYTGEMPTKASTAEYTYTFSGWSSDGGSTVYTTENLPEVTAEVTYVAQFDQATRKYTVTFNMNGHGDSITEQEIEYNKTATEPTEPTATGYTFGGWYTDAACSDGNAFSFTTAITENITLYAKWTAESGYTVTFKNYDGSTLETDTDVLSGATPSYDGSTPEKAGDTYNTYSFSGWSNGTQTYASTLPAVTGDVTYVAQFTATPKSEGTVTYMYTYGGTNGSEWVTTGLSAAAVATNQTSVIGLKVGTTDTFSLTASGKKAVITMTGYSNGSSSSQSYVTVSFNNGSTSLGTLTGTTPAGKVLGNYTFTSDGVFENASGFTSIEFTCNATDNTKSYAITSVTIIIIEEQGATTVDVTGVTLDYSTATLQVGGTQTLTAIITPSNATNTAVTWESSNTSVATVDENGVVTAVAAGTANITVTTEDGGKTATCTVTVEAASSGGGETTTVDDTLASAIASITDKVDALNLTSNEGYFKITSSGGSFTPTDIPSLGGTYLLANGGSRVITVTCNNTAKNITVTVGLGLATGSDFATAGTAVVKYPDGTTEEISGLSGEYTFELAAGESVVITPAKRIALISATAVVTPATTS